MRTHAPEAKVALLIGGGSGHEPMYTAFVGENLADGAVCGHIFAAPTPDGIVEATRAVDRGRGVLYVYGNYAGDNMNVKLAIKQAAAHGLIVKTVVANDDVPSAPKDERGKRRGVAGEVLMWKVGGARAAEGADLEEVIAAAQKAIDNTRSIVGVGSAA
jgi:dihydroxyacetone kinase-like protein